MNDEIKAQRLAAWLESPAGTEPPEDLDPEVLGAVWALVPDRAPTARVSLDDILGAVTTGPFASEAPGVEAPTTGTVVEFPVDGRSTSGTTAGATRDEARPPVRLVAHAGGRAEQDEAQVGRSAEPARRRAPSRAWMLPAIGLTLAAAAATLLVVPQMGKLDRPDLAEQEALRERTMSAPSAVVAPSPSGAPSGAPPSEAPYDATLRDAGAPGRPPADAGIAEMASPEPTASAQPMGGVPDVRAEEEARLAARGRGADEADRQDQAPGGWGPPAMKDAEGGGRGSGGYGSAGLDGVAGGVGGGEALGNGSAGDKGGVARSQAPAATPVPAAPATGTTSSAPAAQAGAKAAAPSTSQAASRPASSMSSSYAPPPPPAAAAPAEIPEATAAKRPATEDTWDEAPVVAAEKASSKSGGARDPKRDARSYLPEAGPAAPREAADDSLEDGDAYGVAAEEAVSATRRVESEKKERSSATEAKPKAAPRTDASNVATRSARTTAVPLDYDPDWYRPLADVAAAFDAARADEAAGRWEEAAIKWRALTADGRSTVAQDAALRCGKALRALGRTGDALSVVESGLRRSGANTVFRASLLAQRGDLLAALGRATEAEVAWAEAAALNASR